MAIKAGRDIPLSFCPHYLQRSLLCPLTYSEGHQRLVEVESQRMKKHLATGLKKKKKKVKNCMRDISVRDFYASSRESVPLKQVLETTVSLCSRKQTTPYPTPRRLNGRKKKMLEQKQSAHDSQLSFQVNRLIKAQHQSVSGTFATEDARRAR